MLQYLTNTTEPAATTPAVVLNQPATVQVKPALLTEAVKHVKGAHPEKYDEFMKTPDRLQHGIHTTPVPVKEVKEIPATPAPEVTTKSLQSDPGPAPIHQGDRVRHTTKYPLFPGIGIVKKISLKGDEVLVDFGSGTEWTDRKNLEVVSAEAKS
jgi:hypothetical protein